MVVANNVAAMNSNRQLKIIMDGKKKATEKLSSGYRINRSADDAAGLSISEKMRWQIRGLNKGMQNITDGISLIDVADGAMQEMHNILQRVRELSIQAYNDTNTSSDRDAIQAEVDQSLKEIDHIVDTTTFNTKPLLKGNYQWKGAWSNDIDDNVSAKIDFSGLISKSNTALDLYNNVFNLIGTKISFSCGTCNTVYNSIEFGGSETAKTTENFENVSTDVVETYGNINLSDEGYFNEINSLLDTYIANYQVDDKGNSIHKEDTKETTDVKELAKKIACGLASKTTSKLSEAMKGHFDRAVTTDDGNGVIVYDYRDNDKLSNFHSNGTADARVVTDSKVTLLEHQSLIESGTTITYEDPLHIECGAKGENYIDINLPALSTQSLGIYDYKVNKYDYNEDTSSPEYKKAYKEYEESARQISYTETYTYYDIEEIKPATPPVYGTVNGESTIIQKGTPGKYKSTPKTGERTIYETVYDKPKPVGKITKVYDPDSVDLIDKAIAEVSARRSEMGAMHNRLEHAYNINTNTSENTSSAESKIRDTDMSTEMVNYSKHSILEQAGQSMLAQANAMNQGVLTLLQ